MRFFVDFVEKPKVDKAIKHFENSKNDITPCKYQLSAPVYCRSHRQQSLANLSSIFCWEPRLKKELTPFQIPSS